MPVPVSFSYEKQRKLIKWLFFSFLITLLTTLAGKDHVPTQRDLFLSALAVELAGYSDLLFDRNVKDSQGRADLTLILHTIIGVLVAGYATYECGEVVARGTGDTPANWTGWPTSFFVVAAILGGVASFYSENESASALPASGIVGGAGKDV